MYTNIKGQTLANNMSDFVKITNNAEYTFTKKVNEAILIVTGGPTDKVLTVYNTTSGSDVPIELNNGINRKNRDPNGFTIKANTVAFFSFSVIPSKIKLSITGSNAEMFLLLINQTNI